ncbi:MAG: hypothetical protein ACI92E_002659 [Oceanicoccus sp.]
MQVLRVEKIIEVAGIRLYANSQGERGALIASLDVLNLVKGLFENFDGET